MEAATYMAGLNKKRVEEIFTKSKQEKWPYPKIFDALKDAGVEYYETEVATHGIIYHGLGDSISEPPPLGFTPLKVSADFDACLLYTSPSPRDRQKSRMPSSA